MINLSIIGSSKIVEEHIKSAKKNKFKIISIFSTNSKSKNILFLKKKYKIQKAFINFKNFLSFSKHYKSAYLICPRIKDNKKFLVQCLEKTNSKIMIEKPLFLDPGEYKKFYKYNNRIFISYNRIYYKSIKLFKKKLSKKKNYLSAVCPEKNRKSIITNSCHIISIFCFMFKNLKIKILKRKANLIELCLYNNKNFIRIVFSFNNNENFKIETLNSKNKILISPIEKMQIFNGIKTIYKNNIRVYMPRKIMEINENNFSKNCKPGFFNQMKEFRLFVYNKKKIFNNLKFGHEVIKICSKISKI
jgi:hypothetical protein